MAHKDSIKNELRSLVLKSGNVKAGETSVFQGKTSNREQSMAIAIAARKAELLLNKHGIIYHPTTMDEQQGEKK